MTLFSKILCGFVIVALLPFFYLAARTLKTHETYRGNYLKYQAAIDQAKVIGKELQHGKFAPGSETELLEQGIRQAELELYALTVQRGRVWRRCLPSDPDPNTGAVNVRIGDPNPHQIRPIEPGKNTSLIVYVFEDRPVSEKGVYVGEFKVTNIGEENVVTLTPSLALNPNRGQENTEFLDKLRKSKAATEAETTWVLYDVMPVDEHDAYAGMQPDDFTGLIPPESIDEYRRHGTPAAADDSPDNKMTVDGQEVYRRRLRDYAVSFREADRLYTVLRDELDAYSRDNASLQKAEADARGDLTKADEYIAEATENLNKMKAEAKTAADYLASVEAEQQRLNDQLTARLTEVQTIGKKLVEMELKALADAEARVKSAISSAAP